MSGVSTWQSESVLRRTHPRIGRSSGRKSYPRPPASACARATIGRCGSRSPLTPIVSLIGAVAARPAGGSAPQPTSTATEIEAIAIGVGRIVR